MKAWRVNNFGGPEVLTLEDVPLPTPSAGEVLVRVAAAGVGPWDGWVRAGQSAVPQPLPLTPGSDISGTVAAIGEGVTGLAVGDAVFGVTNPRFIGGYAEYALASADMLALKPAGLDFLTAAAIPVVSVTARQALARTQLTTAGSRVLITGAAGSVGRYAVQLARAQGLHVIATVRRAGDVEPLLALGAHEVIVLGQDAASDAASWTSGRAESVDAVVDLTASGSQRDALTLLRRGGRFVSAVSQPHAEVAALAVARDISPDFFFLVHVTTDELHHVAEALAKGVMRADAPGTVLALGEAVEAHEMLEGKRATPGRGKIVLRVADL